MLIVYRKADRLVASNSGTNSYLPEGPPFEIEVQNAVNRFGGTPEDYGEYRLHDERDADLVQAILRAGSYELVFDAQGNPTGVRVYPRLTASASPNPAAVNAVVEVTAALPPDTPDTEVMFAVDGGTPVTEPVVQGQAVHAYAFAQPGTYRITVSSQHHGTAVVEVTVQ